MTVNTATFLTSPSPPTCKCTRINFATTPLPEYTPHFAILIHNLLTPLECSQLLSLAESTTNPTPGIWSPAEVNIGNGHQRMILETRNCGRIIWDDFGVAEKLMGRIMPHLPDEVIDLKGNACVTGNGPARRKEVWRISRLNERLRFLKYTPGMYFHAHCDGNYVTPNGSEISFLTVHVYLNGDGAAQKSTVNDDDDTATTNSTPADTTNASTQPPHQGPPTATTSLDPENEPLVGGATRFFSTYIPDRYLDIKPQTGACLVFQHRGLVHSGEEVVSGLKYTVRSDVMYEQVKE